MGVRQIAEKAGLSIATVSNALNDGPNISEATKARVREIAKELKYRRNSKLGEFMSLVRSSSPNKAIQGCFAIMSFHPTARPWEFSPHHRRIYAGMTQRAEQLGYRLEPLWLRAPGMTHRRFRAILEARGIQGLLCFSSPVEDQVFPEELTAYAIVTTSLTIRTPLHRVTTHFFNDTWLVLERLYKLGYRRPGLLIGVNDDYCSGHACSSAFLGWNLHRLGTEAAVPLLRQTALEEASLLQWYRTNRPDVIVLMHGYDNSARDLLTILKRARIEVPRDVGIAAGVQVQERGRLAGLEIDSLLVGSWAVELLADRVINRDMGIPTHPRVEMIASHWRDGESLQQIGH